jgi:hypothetical protein
MLQIDVLVEQARGYRAATCEAAARRRSARADGVPLRVRVGGMLIRLGRTVAGDPRGMPALQG